MLRYIIIPHDDSKQTSMPYGNAEYRVLQQIVGGYIELVTLQDPNDQMPPVSMYVHEEGRITGDPVNDRATAVARRYGWPDGYDIVGNVVVLGPPDREGNDTDAPLEFAVHHMDILY